MTALSPQSSPSARAGITHLLDDFGMGGVMRALEVFNQPEINAQWTSAIHPVSAKMRIAPKLETDVIITHFPPSWARLSFLIGLRLRNPAARMIHVEHSYTPGFERLHVSKPARFRWMIRMAMRCFDQIICVSDAQRKWLEDMGCAANGNIRTIHPWSGRGSLRHVPPPQWRSGQPLRLGAYGRFDAIKNFGPLIDAAASIGPSVQLHLGGSGPQEGMLAQAAEGAPNVHLHGHISDVDAFLARVDAVIVPSLRESYGLVAAEARLAARPIIVADVDGLPEQVGHAGLAAPCGTAQEIAAAIARFSAMPFAAMSRAARHETAGLRGQTIAQWGALLSEMICSPQFKGQFKGQSKRPSLDQPQDRAVSPAQ